MRFFRKEILNQHRDTNQGQLLFGLFAALVPASLGAAAVGDDSGDDSGSDDDGDANADDDPADGGQAGTKASKGYRTEAEHNGWLQSK